MLHRSNAFQCLRRAARARRSDVYLALSRTPLSGRQYSTTYDGPSEIAVLGGGITGLSTAYWLTRKAPGAKITLYEASDRFGGWVRSTEVDTGAGKILFESGPRTLRTSSVNALVTQDMIADLGLEEDIIFTSKTDASARNRYIYYPDHLVRIPFPIDNAGDTISALLFEPAFRGIAFELLKEPFQDARPDYTVDESVGSFLSRRFGKTLVNNLVSAGLHGIYAGDVWQLSAKSLMTSLWELEGRYGTMLKALLETQVHGALTDVRDIKLREDLTKEDELDLKMKSSSVYAFRKGLSQLTDALKEYLDKNENVTLLHNSTVTNLGGHGNGGKINFSVESKSGKVQADVASSVTKDLVISTIPSKTLYNIFVPNGPAEQMAKTPLNWGNSSSATVMVVNLYFREFDVLPVMGFGYLIPQTVSFEQNPERALGVIFDSDAVVGQDTAPGTKLTVMMGGHYWDGWDSYPSAEEATQMALDLLERHLGRIPKPVKTMASLQKDCIPQYKVGHEQIQKIAHKELVKFFGGRLRVAGPSYHGVGLHDCTRAAYDVTEDVKGWNPAISKAKTGLESFAEGIVWEHKEKVDEEDDLKEKR